MRILMLSWEYPPKKIGGLSTHVYFLSHALQKQGHEVHVITCEEDKAPIFENDLGVYIHRVEPYKIETTDFIKWVMQLNFAIIEEAARLYRKYGDFDIIHAHDWLTAFAAKSIKWSYDTPMVSTIHATEYGRNNGIKTEMQRYISSTEWMLASESWKVIVCSNFMRKQVSELFNIGWDKIWTISNGVSDGKVYDEDELRKFRETYAQDDEKIVFFIGRHVFEKGIQYLIEASPEIVRCYNKVKFIISGKGPMTEELVTKVRYSGLYDKFKFIGYIDDESRNKLYKVSDVAVFPSIYEPFGIVALEAMTEGCPVVVSDTGGLGEIVKHEYNGLKCYPGKPDSLSTNVIRLLKDKAFCDRLSQNAIKDIEVNYTWEYVASKTNEMYETVLKEAIGTRWSKK